MLSPTQGQVAHALLTRPPLIPPKGSPFDLNVLCTPPAFILSQDQTLEQIVYSLSSDSRYLIRAIYSSFLLLFRVVFSLGFFDRFFFALAFLLCTFFFCCSIVKFQFFCRRFRDSFIILPLYLIFVKHFFQLFFIFYVFVNNFVNSHKSTTTNCAKVPI